MGLSGWGRNPASSFDSGIFRLAKGTSGFDSGIFRLAKGPSSFDSGIFRLAKGTSGFDSAIFRLARGTSDFDSAIFRLARGTSDFDSAIFQSARGTSSFDSAIFRVERGIRSFRSGIFHVERVVRSFRSGVPLFAAKGVRNRPDMPQNPGAGNPRRSLREEKAFALKKGTALYSSKTPVPAGRKSRREGAAGTEAPLWSIRAGDVSVRISAKACPPNPNLGLPRRSAAKPGTRDPKILVKSTDSSKPTADGSSWISLPEILRTKNFRLNN